MIPSPTDGSDHFLQLADGRTLAYRAYGATDGFPVLALHGTPGSRFKFAVTDRIAARLGLRLLAIDRWGYGATSPHPEPTLEAFVADVRGLLRELGIDRLAVLGISGGAPFAAAVAAQLGRQVLASALVSPVGPIAGTTAPALLGLFHRFAFTSFARRRWLMRSAFGAFRRGLLRRPNVAMRAVVARAPRIDREMLADRSVHQRLTYAFQVGLALGTTGMETDMALFSAPWGIDLGSTTAPTRIWIGLRDTSVPRAAVDTLANRIPKAETVPLPEAGHLWVAHHYDEVLGWIATAAEPRS